MLYELRTSESIIKMVNLLEKYFSDGYHEKNGFNNSDCIKDLKNYIGYFESEDYKKYNFIDVLFINFDIKNKTYSISSNRNTKNNKIKNTN